MITFNKDRLPTADEALKGRDQAIEISGVHYVLNSSMKPPYPKGTETIILGLGCFWGAEQRFWQIDGVYTTAVGYAAGVTPNPTYQEVCSGETGHNEVVLVVYWPGKVSVQELLTHFWEAHNPTQGMRQGNDRGTQYRSAIYYNTPVQQQWAEAYKIQYEQKLQQLRHDLSITTEILPAPTLYFAEEYHQQYLAKNPNGYCGLGGLEVPLN